MNRKEPGLEIVHMANETKEPVTGTGYEATRAVTREQQSEAHPLGL